MIMQSDKDKEDKRSSLQRFPAWDRVDHLTYLEKRPSILQREYEDRIGETGLVCASCGGPVTKVSEKIEVFGRHDHSFANLGYLVRLGCFRNADGCFGVQGVSYGYSWFRGYSWQIQVCRNCFSQLGWKYMSPDESFFGLIFAMLREQGAEDENSGV